MESERSGGGLDLGALGHGLMWGIAVILFAGFILAMMISIKPLASDLTEALPYVIQGVGCLMAGVLSARRAGGSGLMHGLLSGLLLLTTITMVQGVMSDLPPLGVFAKNTSVGLAAGALGGVIGVNTR